MKPAGHLPDPRRRAPPNRRRPARGPWIVLAGLVAVGIEIAILDPLAPRAPVEAPAIESVAAPPPALHPAEINPWKAAALRVEEDRGHPIGRAARVQVPAELRHYPDPRRFLAVQVAGWMEQKYPLPHDEAELAQMIERGDLVEVPSLGAHYILYGVGANATDDPLGHYDRATNQEIPLYPRYDVFEDAAAEWSATVAAKSAAAARPSGPGAQRPQGGRGPREGSRHRRRLVRGLRSPAAPGVRVASPGH